MKVFVVSKKIIYSDGDVQSYSFMTKQGTAITKYCFVMLMEIF